MKYEARQRGYKVLRQCKVSDVLPYTGRDAPPRLYAGHMVKMTSLRYQTFCKSTKCVCCGIEGTVFLLELPKSKKPVRPHFNLYARREGKLVQMTKDHKQPKSKGGRDFIGNMQTMCADCNELKSDKHPKGGNEKVLSGLRKIRDVVQIVYTVSLSGYALIGGVFATTEEGIREIVLRHAIEYFQLGEDELEVLVRDDRYVVVNTKDHGSLTYTINTLRRI